MTLIVLKDPGEEELSLMRSRLREIKAAFGVRRIGIFGSVIRGEEKPSSDIDILVEYETGFATFKNFMGLIEHLEEMYKRPVDLVTTGGINPYIRPYVEKEVVWC